MWIRVLWAGLRVAMWITHVGGQFRHGLLEKSLNFGRNDFQEEDEDSNFSVFRVRRFTEWPESLH